jgi:DNA-directed RNA polymerase subunit RPC12/RpoP
MGIKCPHCAVMTSLIPLFIKDEEADIVNSHTAAVKAITDGDNQRIQYGIYVCQDCGERFIAKGTYVRGKDDRFQILKWFPVYPIPTREVSNEIPKTIKGEFQEAALCFAISAFMACVFMCQRVLESICQDKKVSGLNDLQTNGIISKSLFDRATEIRLWAGITKHKPVIEPVLTEDAEELLNYLESILNSVYVEPAKYERLKQKRQQIKEAHNTQL